MQSTPSNQMQSRANAIMYAPASWAEKDVRGNLSEQNRHKGGGVALGDNQFFKKMNNFFE